MTVKVKMGNRRLAELREASVRTPKTLSQLSTLFRDYGFKTPKNPLSVIDWRRGFEETKIVK